MKCVTDQPTKETPRYATVVYLRAALFGHKFFYLFCKFKKKRVFFMHNIYFDMNCDFSVI